MADGERWSTASTALRRLLEGVVMALMAALALVVLFGIGFRKAGAALVWYDEVASILLAWLTYYGAALAVLHRAHIGVPTLVDHLPAPWRSVALWVGELVVLAFFGILAWAGLQVQAVLTGTSLVSLPAVPAAVAQSVIPIGAVLCMVAQLLSLPRVMRAGPAGAAAEEED